MSRGRGLWRVPGRAEGQWTQQEVVRGCQYQIPMSWPGIFVCFAGFPPPLPRRCLYVPTIFLLDLTRGNRILSSRCGRGMYTLGNQFSLLAEAVGKGWKDQRVRTLVGEAVGLHHICEVSPREYGKGWLSDDA